MIQVGYGPQNTETQVFFSDTNEAAIFVRAQDGSSPLCAVLTNLAAWRADGTIVNDQELKRQWLLLDLEKCLGGSLECANLPKDQGWGCKSQLHSVIESKGMAHGDVIIRTAKVEDAPQLASMHVASWRETYSGILPDAMLAALSVEQRAAMWDQVMRQPANHGSMVVHLAEADGAIVGFGSCGEQRTERLKAKGFDGEISAIYVLRTYQGKGLGVRLLRTMASGLVSGNFAAASLWVLKNNQVARRFYERHGAQVIDEREDARKDAVLVELAYGWTDLQQLSLTAKQFVK